jgi:hypothetical protein
MDAFESWQLTPKQDNYPCTGLKYVGSTFFQPLVFHVCRILKGSGMHVLDTHERDYYKVPTAKIDVSLSASEHVRPPFSTFYYY